MSNRFSIRESGVLLHISSLPSKYGIGGLGKEAYYFVDFLAKTNQKYWQTLPLNYPGYGHSPYNPISCFAGNPWLIDPEALYEQGFISDHDLQHARLPISNKVNYSKVIKVKTKLLQIAYKNFIQKGLLPLLNDYLEKEAAWLKPFMAFCYLKDSHKAKEWQKWGFLQNSELPLTRYSELLFDKLMSFYSDKLFFYAFQQWLFDIQMDNLKSYADNKGIIIIGDIPLYVSLFSADAWSRPEIFELDENGYPLRVAGVPPDAFSETGQLWGNPLYRWNYLQKDGFHWWKQRLYRTFRFAHRVRLDHFIGYVNYWAIPISTSTKLTTNFEAFSAIDGQWCSGPGKAFFDEMIKIFPVESFIAEDLGILTDEVNAVRDFYSFPGMIILQFCFEHDQNDILAFPENRIIYTGTHDNQTTKGWFQSNKSSGKPANDYLAQYLLKKGFINKLEDLNSDTVASLMIKLAYTSPCHIAIIPMQDILNLDDTSRMNIPGIAEGNWQWRMTDFILLNDTDLIVPRQTNTCFDK